MKNRKFFQLLYAPGFILLYGIWQCIRAADMNTEAETLQMGFAILALFFAVIAFGSVVSAVTVCRACARSSRRSQNVLIQKFTLCRRLLPFMMVGEILFCGLATVALVLSEIIWTMGHVEMNGGGMKLLFAMVIAVFAILWMIIKSFFSVRKCFALFKPEDSRVIGVNLPEVQAPELWQWVRSLTSQAQLTPPDNIVVGFFDCFYVTANPVQIEKGERLTGNTLYLPLTYLSLLNEAEIAAVVGHELGHFTGEDTQYSLRFAPLYAGMQNSLQQMAKNMQDAWIDRLVLSPALNMAMWFLQTFHETVNHWSRIRELAADKTGASVSSPSAFACALLRISALSEPVERYLEGVLRGRTNSDNWTDGLVLALQKQGPLDVLASIDSEIAHPMDSHPTTRARITALNLSLDEELLSRASRAVAPEENLFFPALFGPVASALSCEISQEIEPLRAEIREEIEAEATLATEAKAIWSSSSMAWIMMIVGIVLIFGGGYLVLFQHLSAICWLFTLVGLPLGMMGNVALQRSRQPLFTLTPQSITSIYLPQPLPLEYVERYEVVVISGVAMLHLYVRNGDRLNITTKRCMQVFRYEPQESRVVAVVSNPWCEEEGQKVKLDAVTMSQIVGQYISSAHARAELSKF